MANTSIVTTGRALAALCVFLAAISVPAGLAACECVWQGPFLTVAPAASSIVRAKVLGYHGKSGEQPLAMDLEVLETLGGERATSPLTVWGDSGMHCRPYVSQFPIGSEWIFAFDGPGSRPAMSPGRTISVCGRYWLEVKGDAVVGPINPPAGMETSQQLALSEFRVLLAAAIKSGPPAAREQISLTGEVMAGERFEQPFGPDLVFRLDPSVLGWGITVREVGRDEDLARLSPPLHGPLNPLDIAGWQFRNADNTGPNRSGEGNVNGPGERREFIFSPDVGRSIAGPAATTAPRPEDIEMIGTYGQGTLRIVDYRLAKLAPGKPAVIAWMRFAIDLSWPKPAVVERPCRVESDLQSYIRGQPIVLQVWCSEGPFGSHQSNVFNDLMMGKGQIVVNVGNSEVRRIDTAPISAPCRKPGQLGFSQTLFLDDLAPESPLVELVIRLELPNWSSNDVRVLVQQE